ncbi:hypothetical protein Pen02_48500 [Plantactinospora endophytica]|uniref:Uncharacterized protein n=1 Tax=Plantactinospora endophytica TaxID=673535 RepID=A0ABQ4E5E1_9ACTN|nr:hypothetical protein Pen02_48500 [Plantactinospora endophytica]
MVISVPEAITPRATHRRRFAGPPPAGGSAASDAAAAGMVEVEVSDTPSSCQVAPTGVTVADSFVADYLSVN